MEISDLNLMQARQSIAQLSAEKNKLKNQIDQINVNKTRLEKDKNQIQGDKKDSNKKFQEQIKKLTTKQQKDFKRREKQRASDSFDSRIKSKAKDIQNLKQEIAKFRQEISRAGSIIGQIKSHIVFLNNLEKLKAKMLIYIKTKQYSQFSESLLSVIYPKLPHAKRTQYMEVIADTIEKLETQTNNILQNLSLDNIDYLLNQFIQKFKNFPDHR